MPEILRSKTRKFHIDNFLRIISYAQFRFLGKFFALSAFFFGTLSVEIYDQELLIPVVINGPKRK
ncbi:MAG TPA: hypothetical protein DCX32_03040 [Candidatus Moranbacteria bacterium]|nr:hypothetical protein [Candidatus Moranbacteria bacterium]